MSTSNWTVKPLQDLFQFPYYPNADAYAQAHGGQVPPWDATKAPKFWADSNPSGIWGVIYNIVAMDGAGKFLLDANGQPYLMPMALDPAYAKSYNIPPAGLPAGTVVGMPVASPIRPLADDEVLFIQSTLGGGTVAVRNKDWSPAGPGASGVDPQMVQNILTNTQTILNRLVKAGIGN